MATLSSIITSFTLITVGLVAGSAEEGRFYELRKGNFSVKLTNWGASVVSVLIPDKHGRFADVVLGYDSPEDYKNNTPNFGATVGRVANRIKGAQFFLNGTLYKLIPNDGKNTLHGGPKGFGKVAWNVRRFDKYGPKPYIIFSYNSPDGDQGFPGKVAAKVKYTVSKNYTLDIEMSAKVMGKPTPLNLAHHSYWNLAGHNSGTILDHRVRISGSEITLLDPHLIPVGTLQSVSKTPYDFRTFRRVGSRIAGLPGGGYDINYVVEGGGTVAAAYDRVSGRAMEVAANQRGLQFYTANSLKGVVGKGGALYGRYGGVCFESQGFPDAVHYSNFPSIVIGPGRRYKHLMMFRFFTMARKELG